MFPQVVSGDGEVVAVMKEGSLFGEVDNTTQYSHTLSLQVLHVIITSAFYR